MIRQAISFRDGGPEQKRGTVGDMRVVFGLYNFTWKRFEEVIHVALVNDSRIK